MSGHSEQLKADDALVGEADAWVMLVTSGAATEGDARALLAWRKRSAVHEAAYRDAVRLRAAVVAAARRERDAEFIEPGVDAFGHCERGPVRFGRRQVLAGAIAASAAGASLVIAGKPLGLWRAEPAEFTTRKGERRLVRLADGARIELNTATRLSRRPDLGAHAVELFEGEMMLTTSPRRDAPYIVLAGAGRTVTRDGRVTLRCSGDAVWVTCLAGGATVQVQATERAVLPGQQLRYDDAGLGELVTVDPAVVTAWRSGILVFRRARVGDVIHEINRYRDGQILIASRALADRRIDGTFHVEQVDQIFEQLRSVYGASVTHLPGGTILLT